MKWALYMMLFVTPAVNHPPDYDPAKKESSHIWALQSTTTMEFTSIDACAAIGNTLIDSILKVDTMTVRAWCFCDEVKQCPDEDTAVAAAASVADKKLSSQSLRRQLPAMIAKKPQIETKQDYTIVRLYPLHSSGR